MKKRPTQNMLSLFDYLKSEGVNEFAIYYFIDLVLPYQAEFIQDELLDALGVDTLKEIEEAGKAEDLSTYEMSLMYAKVYEDTTGKSINEVTSRYPDMLINAIRESKEKLTKVLNELSKLPKDKQEAQVDKIIEKVI